MSEIRAHAVGAAPGKVILFGEHAVVHGRPAIAVALSHGLGVVVRASSATPKLHIPRYLVVEAQSDRGSGSDAVTRAFHRALDLVGPKDGTGVDVTIDGELPLGVGLGSSAAFSVSLIRGLADYSRLSLSDETLRGYAHELESIFHGNPSGLDHSVIIQNEALRFDPIHKPRFESIQLGSCRGLTPRRKTLSRGLKSAQPELSADFRRCCICCRQTEALAVA